MYSTIYYTDNPYGLIRKIWIYSPIILKKMNNIHIGTLYLYIY